MSRIWRGEGAHELPISIKIGLTLEALPPRGGDSAGCPKKDKRRARRGSGE